MCVLPCVYIFILYIKCNTGNSVSPRYLTAFETDVLFTCSHVLHSLVITYICYTYIIIYPLSKIMCVLFFLTSYQRFLMSRVGRSYMGLFLFFCRQKGSIFQNHHLGGELVTAYCPDGSVAQDKDDRRKKTRVWIFHTTLWYGII